ncbi:zinc finger protein 577-like isoform X1 [Meleagris gallopavo]|uniref:zinc finger protein 577-like isoform X1 n=1 Tax=Meleagris gallopavo TaxID=9103 RepID=UPI000549B89D|nr:zinc finger protein 577-like isoform X1 [Meleagris gallopavo]XP_010710500.1 zinc finger protein 577-like isoform X1 [Meleagris gallopavo]XP_019471715.1 zinc finger protein 577-like isoform X1 [Meleagris gallopavo]
MKGAVGLDFPAAGVHLASRELTSTCSPDCDLAKPEVLLQMEREEPCVPAEPDLEGTAVSMKPAAEPDGPACVSGEALLQVETEQSPKGRRRSLEDSRSPSGAPDSSAHECLASPPKQGSPGCVSPEVIIPTSALVAQVPQEAIGAPADLSHLATSPPSPIPTCCQEVLTLSLPPSLPPAAAGADAGIPGEVLQERMGAEKGLPKEDLKGAGNSGQYLAADAPEEPSREEMPDLCQTAAHVEPSGSADLLGRPEESVGRTAACQRNSSREKFYRCVVCGKNFLLKINLVIHQKSHSNWVPYVCIECNQAFMSKKKIRRHLRIRAATGFCPPSDTEGGSGLAPCRAAQPHTQVSSTREQWEKPNPNRFPLSPQKITYTCTECMENFSSQNFLVLHQRTHADRHHFTLCLCCNRSFVWASEFVCHSQSDAGRKGYWCSECQKAYKRLHRP